MANSNKSEEVDLGYIFKKSNDLFKSFAKGILLTLNFFKKYFIVVIVLIIVGFAYGYYKDSNSSKSYNNELIVIPNVESVDYMYDRIEAINAKIADRDTLFLKKIFGENMGRVGYIEAEPIVDIYNFISKSRENIDILRILAQNQDFSDYIQDISTSKYYKYHKINVSSVGRGHSEKIITDLLGYFNENPHFNEYLEIIKETKAYDIKEHYVMISQIDSLVKANSEMFNNNSSVSVSNSTDQHYLIERKRLLIEDLYQLKMEMIDYTSPIKLISEDLDLKPERFLEISNKIKYPIYLIFIFSFIFFIIYLFKILKKYAEDN